MPTGIYPTQEAFAAAAGETFAAAVGDSSLPLMLAAVEALPVHAFPGMTRAPFALTFRSASPVVLPQRSYRLTNASLGGVDIFLTATGRDSEGIVYQAIFN